MTQKGLGSEPVFRNMSLAAIDWRNDQAYAELHKIDRYGLAWEWLRRTDHYRCQIGTVVGHAGLPRMGGLLDVVPALDASEALKVGVHFRRMSRA